MKRVLYSGSVHDQAEKDAVMAVLDGGVTSFAIGKNVAEMEQRVAELFGKSAGVMVNSGSSALYLAVELLNLPAGSEVITSTCTFSTDISSLVRAGLVPVLVDIEADTFNADVSRIEELISPKTRAVLLPNLIGNAPDWDAVRAIADRHDLLVVEDSCDALGHTLRGTPTGTRSDISLTSFANSHIITCAATAAWWCSTTRTSAIVVCCCAVGAGVRRCSCTARARVSATSGKTSTASGTTTCSSSTSSAGTSNRRRWVRRSDCSS
jgi:CDP-6-deoxy-D-xylo-4-hexulose-3-dehydrase